IVVMAHKLGLKVIAEGIETKKQQELLLKLGCDYGQGYLFARPMPRKEFRTYLTEYEAMDSSSGISEKDAVNVTEYYAM
ncbi:MAG: EAL domain-containing protein, partial [Calditrichaeota bacterium]|nr:EAL domain-containing protein [Calditrichota bacterium]